MSRSRATAEHRGPARGDRGAEAATAPAPRARWRLALTGAVVAAVAAAGLLPASALAWLRQTLPWLSHALSRIERLWGGHDGSHVVLFVLVGAALAIVLRRPLARACLTGVAVLAALAVASELVQRFVPGRTPLLADVRDDMVGGLAGLGAVLLLRAAWGVVARR